MDGFLLSAWLLGLASTAHCIGMCGPISLALPLDRRSHASMLRDILQYNLGRVFVYTLMGTLMGFLGTSLRWTGLLQILSIASGLGIILYSWRKYIYTTGGGKRPAFIQKFVAGSIGRLLASATPFRMLLMGMLNGLLPCGMVYTALIGSVVMAHPLTGATYMLFFGLGTLPGLIFVAFSARFFDLNRRKHLQKAAPFIVSIVGGLLIIRGMNLDIPYLSPTFKTDPQGKITQVTCHKPAQVLPKQHSPGDPQ